MQRIVKYFYRLTLLFIYPNGSDYGGDDKHECHCTRYDGNNGPQIDIPLSQCPPSSPTQNEYRESDCEGSKKEETAPNEAVPKDFEQYFADDATSIV